jgi:hypothetical protein
MAKKKYAKKQANTEEVAKYLNQGTPKMVARPFFGITKKDLTAFVNSVMKDFTKVRPSTFKQTVKSANRFINSR